MNERAKAIVYWLRITNDIQGYREKCNSYNLITPSNPRLPQIKQLIPKVTLSQLSLTIFTSIVSNIL